MAQVLNTHNYLNSQWVYVLTCVNILMFGRFSMVQRSGEAPEGLIPSLRVQTTAAEGR